MRRIFPLIGILTLAGSVARAESDSNSEGDGRRFAFHFKGGGGRLGVGAVDLSKEARQALGAPEDAGVLVNTVASDSVAAEAGIKPGDLIVEVAGQKVKDTASIRRALSDKEAGQSVPVVVIRDKRSTTLNAKLREKPKGRDWASVDFPGVDSFVIHGDDLRKELDQLSKRLGDLDTRLHSLESKR
jgi:membrane-associated protease RseP (regulator of RpoE activity)